MERKNGFITKGKWYKGNTHAHTNISDGKLSPSELVSLYRRNGYGFLAITDHGKYGIHEELNSEDFLVLPGVELDILGSGMVSGGKTFCDHIVGLGIPGKNKFKHGQTFEFDKYQTTAEELAQILTNGGNIAIYAHPTWSHKRVEEMDDIQSCIGMEIYNNTCDVNAACGESEAYYNRVLWNGRKFFCFASDDIHAARDGLGGFIVVKAGDLSHKSIIDSIVSGSFYASTGPEIKDFYIEDGKAVVETSACASIGFLSDGFFGVGITPDSGTIDRAECKIRGTETYVRAVCQDEYGRKAWSQPIWI